MNLLQLAERVASAPVEDMGDMLDEAWEALGPIENWSAAQARNFGRCIDAGAWESAAIIMIPSGYGWRLWVPASDRDDQKPRVTIWGPARTCPPQEVEAATSELAIVAASLLARHAARTRAEAGA